MPKQTIRWKFILPIAGAVSLASVLGFKGGEGTRAYLSFTKHRYQEALELYSKIGDDSGAGMVMLAKNEPDEARKHFEKANDQSGLGLSALKKREYREAMKHFVLKNDHRGMGLTHLGMREEQKAKEEFSKANDWSGLGLLHLAKNQYKKAEECFRRVRDDSGLGLVALKERRFEDARLYFTAAKDNSGLGLLALARRDYDRAAVYFTQANDLPGLGYVALARGDHVAAMQHFTRTNDHNGLGDLYSKDQNYAKARAAFEADHNPVKVMQSYRNDHTLPDHLQQAAAYGESAVAQGRMVPECLMELADIYYEMNQTPKALEALEKAASHAGYGSEANVRKGRIYFYLRRFDEAERAFLAVKADDFIGDSLYEDAQKALETVVRYKTLTKDRPDLLQPAESF